MGWTGPNGRRLALLLAALGAIQPGPGLAGPLDAYRWRSRVLVVAADGADDERLLAQRRILAQSSAALAERDLIVLEAVGAGAEARALRGVLGLPDGAFRVVLVGKDGDAKIRRSEPIPAEDLTTTIDAMPMRRREMTR